MTVATRVTFTRLGLLLVFAWLVARGQLVLGLVVFAIAWGLDAVDGYLARRLRQETRFGFIFDKVVDRLLLVSAGIILINQAYLPPGALLLFAKDVVAIPALYIQVRAGEKIRDMGTAGKIMTLLQGAALLWLVLRGSYLVPITFVMGVAGAAIGGWYLHAVAYKKN